LLHTALISAHFIGRLNNPDDLIAPLISLAHFVIKIKEGTYTEPRLVLRCKATALVLLTVRTGPHFIYIQ